MFGSDVLFFTAADANYFELCSDLIASLKLAFGAMPRMRVLDVGLKADQRDALSKLVEAIVTPDWDLGNADNYPAWARAMLSRPFLPKYADGPAIVVWMDADTWVQRPEPLAQLIEASRRGALAIVEETPGTQQFVEVRKDGLVHRWEFSSANVQRNIRNSYERSFGPEIANTFGTLPQFNSGVFALRFDSPTWGVWQKVLGEALERGSDKTVEQNAVNLAIRRGLIPVAPQPSTANFVCVHGLPWIAADGTFVTPQGDPIGVIHFIEMRLFDSLPIRQFPAGDTLIMPLRFSRQQAAIPTT